MARVYRFWICIFFCTFPSAYAATKPHILFILADDLGWNDVGYHGSEIRTPTIDRLANEGVKLERYYVQPMCSPSRTQLLTGRYQIHTGMQHSIFLAFFRLGLPLEYPTLADLLLRSGYSTHMVGKWHLGHHEKEYTPTYRGFDTFYGCYTSYTYYYNHTNCQPPPPLVDASEYTCGVDLHDDRGTELKVVWDNYEYATDLFTKEAQKIVANHNPDEPLFLFLSHLSPKWPLEVPEQYTEEYDFITDDKRRILAGMMSSLDESVKNVTESFKEHGLWDNTVLIFSSDNGADERFGASNDPLRGTKYCLYEGGIRGVAFVHSNLIPEENRGRVSEELMHISDWFPTLISLADGSLQGIDHDGFDIWNAIAGNSESARHELLINIDPLTRLSGESHHPDIFDTRVHAGIISGNWKLLTGNPCDNRYPFEEDSSVWDNVQLFDLKNDPNEQHDVSASHPDVVLMLLEKLAEYNRTALPAAFAENDPEAEASARETGAIIPWADSASDGAVRHFVEIFLGIIMLLIHI